MENDKTLEEYNYIINTLESAIETAEYYKSIGRLTDALNHLMDSLVTATMYKN